MLRPFPADASAPLSRAMPMEVSLCLRCPHPCATLPTAGRGAYSGGSDRAGCVPREQNDAHSTGAMSWIGRVIVSATGVTVRVTCAGQVVTFHGTSPPHLTRRTLVRPSAGLVASMLLSSMLLCATPATTPLFGQAPRITPNGDPSVK